MLTIYQIYWKKKKEDGEKEEVEENLQQIKSIDYKNEDDFFPICLLFYNIVVVWQFFQAGQCMFLSDALATFLVPW